MRLSFRKKKNTSDKIKEATLNILARDGYEDISMRKIAKEADVALGQLTYYYKSKNNLIVSVIDEVLDMFYDGLKERVSSSEKKIEEIVNSIENVINEDSQVDQLLITVISMAQVNKRLNKRLNKFYEDILGFVSSCLRQDNPTLSENDSNMKARLLAGSAIEGMIEKSIGINNLNNSLIRETANTMREN